MDIVEHMLDQADDCENFVAMPHGVINTLRDGAAEIARLRAELEEAVDLVRLFIPSCDWLHHRPADQHDDDVSCPIVDRIAALRERLAARAEGRADRRGEAGE